MANIKNSYTKNKTRKKKKRKSFIRFSKKGKEHYPKARYDIGSFVLGIFSLIGSVLPYNLLKDGLRQMDINKVDMFIYSSLLLAFYYIWIIAMYSSIKGHKKKQNSGFLLSGTILSVIGFSIWMIRRLFNG